MNAKDTIALVERGKAPEGWATALGIYANLSKWPYEVKYYVKCPKCGQGDLVVKRARRGKRGSLFYGCNRYPECDFTVGQRPVPAGNAAKSPGLKG